MAVGHIIGTKEVLIDGCRRGDLNQAIIQLAEQMRGDVGLSYSGVIYGILIYSGTSTYPT
jgi:hypothetical protein